MKIILLTLLTIALYANQQINIEATHFEADQNTHLTTFKGSVKITKENDKINADQVVVKFDNDNKPIEYEAQQNVTFNIFTKTSTIQGSCDKLIYTPKSQNYTLLGDVKIDDHAQSRQISASKVIIDKINGKTIITGQKNKPVKFIFDIKE